MKEDWHIYLLFWYWQYWKRHLTYHFRPIMIKTDPHHHFFSYSYLWLEWYIDQAKRIEYNTESCNSMKIYLHLYSLNINGVRLTSNSVSSRYVGPWKVHLSFNVLCIVMWPISRPDKWLSNVMQLIGPIV